MQSNDGSQTFCNGGASCEVPPGNYLVINHGTGQRFNNIRVPQSPSDKPPVEDAVRYEVWASDQSDSEYPWPAKVACVLQFNAFAAF